MGYVEKEEIRKAIKIKLDNMSEKEVIEKSISIFNRLKSVDQFIIAKEVFTFVGTKCEPRTELLIEELLSKKIVFVPKCTGNGEMKAVRIYRLDDLRKGKFGIKEPVENTIDEFGVTGKAVALVPGYSFDKDGNRVGKGKGFYDRWLSKNKNKVFSIGICFDFQLLDFIPRDNWDEKVNAVITDKRSIFFNIL